MKCTNCVYEEDCDLKSIAKDITGCEGHSREKIPKENQVRCSCCKEWVDRNKAFEHKNGKDYLCFNCY